MRNTILPAAVVVSIRSDRDEVCTITVKPIGNLSIVSRSIEQPGQRVDDENPTLRRHSIERPL